MKRISGDEREGRLNYKRQRRKKGEGREVGTETWKGEKEGRGER